MTELDLLRMLVLFSAAIAPLGTHRVLLPASRARTTGGVLAWGGAAAALWGPPTLAPLSGAWLLFCALSVGEWLLRKRAHLFRAEALAALVPFLFSNIAAVWIVGGTNDLRILGYGPEFSYYAALHGNVLGWMILGAFALLAQTPGPRRRVYVGAVLLSFASFLLIALGIDQLRALKPLGVLGLSLALPAATLVFLREVWTRHRAAAAFGTLSALGLAFTMTLAWRNELGLLAFGPVLRVRGMVAVHGVLNALVVGPALLAAVSWVEASKAADSGVVRGEEEPR